MSFWKSSQKKSLVTREKRLRLEHLEDKRLLAIVWANEFETGVDDPRFDDFYVTDEVVARTIVNRAIDDWEAVITDFNYDNDNNPNTVNLLNDTYSLNISAGPITGRGETAINTFAPNGNTGTGNRPASATITLDDNGGGTGWFFDETPLDDVEFTSIADAFQASFVDATTVGQTHQNDFYRTITHEIGHALGIAFVSVPTPLTDPNASVFDVTTVDVNGNITGLQLDPTPTSPIVPNANDFFLGALNYVGIDQVSRFNPIPVSDPDGSVAAGNGFNADEEIVEHELWQYTLADNTTITFTESGGGHFYEGPVDPNVAGADQHLNELMNPGRVVPAGNNPAETTRQFISDLTVEFLADAYGYTVVLPSTLDSAHVMLDDITGTLLIQGSVRNGTTGAGFNDTITIDHIGDDLRVIVTTPTGTFTERVPYDQVTNIVVHGNGGTDSINSTVEQPLTEVDYVVSTNEDVLEDANSVGGASSTNGIVDISNIVPGSQTPLRAAIIEANAGTGTQAIYVGRGIYNLTLTGSESGGASVNDLDITGNVTLVGAGAGLAVIQANFATTGGHNRVFEVASGGDLSASRLTITGGNVTGAHGGGVDIAAGGSLTLDQVAVVDNFASGNGGGINLNTNAGGTASLTLLSSVVADNTSGMNGGGNLSSGSGSTITLGSTIFANNSGSNHQDIIIGGTVTVNNLGNNLFETASIDPTRFGTAFNDIVGAPVDHVVTSIADLIDATDDAYALSLREAIIAANAGDDTVWLPAWIHRLKLMEDNMTDNPSVFDLDITGNVTLVGAGAGLSVIRADFKEANSQTRVIDINNGGVLHATRLTITGGNVDNAPGGGVEVMPGGELILDRVAVVDNFATGNGGGIDLNTNGGGTASLTLLSSVVAYNESGMNGGGNLSSGSGSFFTLGSTIFANNSAANYQDIVIGGTVGVTNLGNNLFETASINPTIFGTSTNDIVGVSVDHVVTSVADIINTVDDAYAFTLREAIAAANSGDDTVWLPAWTHRLDLMGTGMDQPEFFDLDITGDVTLVGAGAGLSVIKADFEGSNADTRVFEVRNGGTLDASRLTIAGGDVTGIGGGVNVNIGGTLSLDQVAVVNNHANGNGGGIHTNTNAGGSSSLTVLNSVVTGNSTNAVGGGILVTNSNSTFTVGSSVFANNTAGMHSPNLNINTTNTTNQGNNLVENFTSAVSNLFSATTNDHINGNADFVVTSVADTYDDNDDLFSLSLRESVNEANQATGEDDVWIAAWNFVLTRERDYSTQLTDTDVSYGDIDISDSIILRGIAGQTSVDWFNGITIPDNVRDKVFDLLGSTADGTSDATASGADFLIWQQQFGGGVGNPVYENFSADFDDDGDVDGDDQSSIWQAYYGNTLDLEGLTVYS